MQYHWNTPRRPIPFNEKQVLAALKKGPLDATPKADGVRVHLVISDDGNAYLRSRENKRFRALTDIEWLLNAPALGELRGHLAGWTVEMECIALDPGLGTELPCPVTAGILNALAQLDPGRLVFYIFDAYHKNDTALSIDKRRAHFHERFAPATFYSAIFLLLRKAGHVQPLEARSCQTLEELRQFYDHCRSIGWEGLVITPLNAPYVSGKKLGAGWKMKPEETKDGTVTGFVEAVDKDGNPKGMVGSLEVTYEDGTKGTPGAGALNHQERRFIWQNQEEFLGRLCEVRAMEAHEGGALRHPNFYRWRDAQHDKGVKQ